MLFVLVFGLLSGDHHGSGVGDRLHGGDVFGVGSLPLVFVFDVSIECGVAEIGFTAGTDIISFSGFVPGSSFSFVLLNGRILVAFVIGLLLIHY